MKKAGLLFGAAVFLTNPAAGADWERHPTEFGSSIDVGQIVKGTLIGTSLDDTVKADGQFLTRTGVYLTKAATYKERLKIQLTFGGLFWYALPELSKPEYRVVQFGPGVGQAQASYLFGNPESPSGLLQFGLFPIKYNPDSKNLGEYLYRSGTYPSLRYTGGWSLINSSGYLAQGLRFNWNMFGGKLAHDLTLTFERDLEPNHDLSPAYILSWKPAPFFEFGAGAQWAHGFSFQSEKLTPKTYENAYVKGTGLPLGYKDQTSGAWKTQDHFSSDRVQPDDAACLADPTVPCPDGRINDGTFVKRSQNGVPRDSLAYYTFKGFKLMSRAAFDPGVLMGATPGTFKAYGEWALLGVEDQPFYYNKKSERMPIMLGLNLPTFRLLDMFSVEAEFLKSRFRNNNNVLMRKKWPLPLSGEDEILHPEMYDTVADTKDDWKWSIFASKKIREGITLYAQAASDNQRQIAFENGPLMQDHSATEYTKDWYYIVRVEFGI